MARPKSDNPRTEHFTVRLSPKERKVLDRRRGSKSVAEFIRGLFLDDAS